MCKSRDGWRKKGRGVGGEERRINKIQNKKENATTKYYYFDSANGIRLSLPHITILLN